MKQKHIMEQACNDCNQTTLPPPTSQTTTTTTTTTTKKTDKNKILTATASPSAWIAFGKEKHHLPLKSIKFRASHLAVIESN